METREQLSKRVKELEAQVAMLKGSGGLRGVRKRSDFVIGNLPLVCVAMGPDPSRGEVRGHAKGIIAIGDIATGVLAIGGLARGVVAIGGLAVGLVTLGGCSIGVLAAVGGLAIGGIAFGGGAVGGVAMGGGAVGYYATGGGAAGAYVLAANRRDPEAIEFFEQYGIRLGSGRR